MFSKTQSSQALSPNLWQLSIWFSNLAGQSVSNVAVSTSVKLHPNHDVMPTIYRWDVCPYKHFRGENCSITHSGPSLFRVTWLKTKKFHHLFFSNSVFKVTILYRFVDNILPRSIFKRLKYLKMANERSKFSADDNYPDFSEHNNHMSKCLSKHIYEKLYNKVTPNGYTLDNAIQTGVDNPGLCTFFALHPKC